MVADLIRFIKVHQIEKVQQVKSIKLNYELLI